MKEGEDHLSFTDQLEFGAYRLFEFQDQLCLSKHLFGGVDDDRPFFQ